MAEYGQIDALVNNAAAAIFDSPTTYSDKRRRLTMEVNFFAPFELTQAVIPAMTQRGQGWVVNLTSSAVAHVQGPPFELTVELGPDQIEPMSTMVTAVLALCDCPSDRTGGVFISRDLLNPTQPSE